MWPIRLSQVLHLEKTGKQLPDAPNNLMRFNTTHTVNDSLTSNLTSSWGEQTVLVKEIKSYMSSMVKWSLEGETDATSCICCDKAL